jgi:hypothetical protein
MIDPTGFDVSVNDGLAANCAVTVKGCDPAAICSGLALFVKLGLVKSLK